MKDINHHLTDALLMAYSAGTLPEAFDVVVATHVSLCDECRARMHEFDAVGGTMMEDAGTAELNKDSFEATMALITSSDWAEEPRPIRPSKGIFPAPLQSYVGDDVDSVNWRRIGGGVQQAILNTTGDATVRLLRIPGGVAVPDHGHRGTELTLVLQGAFRDETDRFGPGDVEVADEDLEHKPVAEEGVDCICLAATDAPLKFNAMIPRLAQGLFRI